MNIQIKPLFEYPQNKISEKSIQQLNFYKSADLNPLFNCYKESSRPMFEFFRMCLEKYEIIATPALSCFVVFVLSNRLAHLHLYAHALLAIARQEEVKKVTMQLFLDYFNEGFPDQDDLNFAWDVQKSGLINLLETNNV